MTSIRVKSFDRGNSKIVQDAALAALKDVAAQYGLKVESWGGQLNGADATLKFKFSVIGDNGLREVTPIAKAMARSSGVDLEARTQDGWRIVDYNGRAPKYCWVLENVFTKQAMRVNDAWAKNKLAIGSLRTVPLEQPKPTTPDRVASADTSRYGASF